MTPAEELTTAAEKIRALTKAIDAPDLPDQSWHAEECADDERGNCPCIVAQGRYIEGLGPATPMFYVADAETPECAAYIAAMGPPVALALAKLLDSAATTAEGLHGLFADSDSPDEFVHSGALAVARAINGGQP